MEIPEDSLFLQQLAAVIQQLCDTNSDLRSVSPTIFDSVARPSMTIHSYLVRIRRYTKFDTVCFLVALAYLRRLCSQHGAPFCVTHHNIHRLLITSVLASSKANDGAQRPRPPLRRPRPHPALAALGARESGTPALARPCTAFGLDSGPPTLLIVRPRRPSRRRLPCECVHGAVRRHHQ